MEKIPSAEPPLWHPCYLVSTSAFSILKPGNMIIGVIGARPALFMIASPGWWAGFCDAPGADGCSIPFSELLGAIVAYMGGSEGSEQMSRFLRVTSLVSGASLGLGKGKAPSAGNITSTPPISFDRCDLFPKSRGQSPTEASRGNLSVDNC